jgi:hypothetical protein
LQPRAPQQRVRLHAPVHVGGAHHREPPLSLRTHPPPAAAVGEVVVELSVWSGLVPGCVPRDSGAGAQTVGIGLEYVSRPKGIQLLDRPIRPRYSQGGGGLRPINAQRGWVFF